MRNVIGSARSSLSCKLVLLGTVGLIAAGCSGEVTRFADIGGAQHTGSIPTPAAPIQQASLGNSGGTYPGASSSGVTSAPLAAPGQTYGGAQTYGADRSYGASTSYAAAPTTNPAQSSANTVTVGQGDTVYTIARRYNIPPIALMQANGLSDPTQARPGQQLSIPTYSASNSSWQVTSAQPAPSQSQSSGQQATASSSGTLGQLRTPAPSQSPASGSGASHTVSAGETVHSISRRYGVSANQIVSANGLGSPDRIRIGQRLTIPGASGNVAQVQQKPTQVASLAPTSQPATQQTQTDASSEPTTRAASAPKESEVQQAAYTPTEDATGEASGREGIPDPGELSAGKFRWPVRGRVIASFGDKADGDTNQGLNISVPEGTSVRAAENGVVAYAGSELKGYGNLVLVRHADDWVTAYAHNSELSVKRGDTVTRGQVIAKAGQTGNVSSPQLHFELRKGSQPVDPLSHMSEN